MDAETQRSIDLGCWDGKAACAGSIKEFTTAGNKDTPDFELPMWFCDYLIDVGFGKDVDSAVRERWTRITKVPLFNFAIVEAGVDG